MKKAEFKVNGGKLIRVKLVKKEGRVLSIKITGDFFLHPEELIEALENYLIEKKVDQKNITRSIEVFLKDNRATLLGVSPSDFARCIIMASVSND